jgi:hypothetical protein
VLPEVAQICQRPRHRRASRKRRQSMRFEDGKSIDTTLGHSLGWTLHGAGLDPGVVLYLFRTSAHPKESRPFFTNNQAYWGSRLSVICVISLPEANPMPVSQSITSYIARRRGRRRFDRRLRWCRWSRRLRASARITGNPSAHMQKPPLAGCGTGRASERQRGPRISSRQSKVSAWVVPTNEGLMIARHAQCCGLKHDVPMAWFKTGLWQGRSMFVIYPAELRAVRGDESFWRGIGLRLAR